MPHVLNFSESKNIQLSRNIFYKYNLLVFLRAIYRRSITLLYQFSWYDIRYEEQDALPSIMYLFFCVRLFQEKFFHLYFPNAWYHPSDKHCFCLTISALLCNGKFHKHLQEIFVPLVVRYVDLMESSIAQSIHRGFEQETWQPVK